MCSLGTITGDARISRKIFIISALNLLNELMTRASSPKKDGLLFGKNQDKDYILQIKRCIPLMYVVS